MAKQERGYDDKRFQTVVDKTLRCQLCRNILKDPVQCRQNEDLFCRLCIIGFLEQHSRQTCPKCEEELTVETLVQAPKAVTQWLCNLQISCEHANRGCPELVKLDRLQDHVRNCDYRPKACNINGCTDEVNKKDQKHHEDHECAFRKVKCGYCEEEMTYKVYGTHGCVLKEQIQELKNDLVEVRREMQSNQEKTTREVRRMKDEILWEMKCIREATEGPHHFKTRKDIIVAGGFDGKFRLNSVEMYSWSKGAWTTLQAMNHRRSGASMFVHNQQVFVAGGNGVRGEKHESIEKMGQLGEWENFNAKLPCKSYGHSCVVHEDHMVITGGLDVHSEVSEDVYKVDLTKYPSSPKWLSSMPKPLFCHSSLLFQDKIVIAGGMTGKSNNDSSDGVLLYDIGKNEWQEMPPLPYPVNGAAAVVWKGNVLVIGGSDGAGNAMKTAVLYDASTGEWEMLPPMKSEREGCSAVITGNVVVVMGGYNDREKYLNSVECLNLSRYVWEDLPAMIESRSYLNAVVK